MTDPRVRPKDLAPPPSIATDLRNQARLQTLAKASQAFAALQPDYQGLLQTIARLISEEVGDVCDVRLVSEDGQWLQTVAIYHPDPQRLKLLREFYRRMTPADQGASGRVLQTGQPLLVPEVDPQQLGATLSPQGREYLERFGMASLLSVPLRSRGANIGVLAMARDRPGNPYTLEDQTLLQDLADRAALAIENARLYEAERRARLAAEQAREHAARLQAITAALAEAITAEQVAQVMAAQVVPACEAAAGAVVLLARDGVTCEMAAHAGYSAETLAAWRQFPVTAAAPVTDAIRQGRAIFLATRAELEGAYPALAPASSGTSEAWAAIPFVLEGHALGALALSFDTRRNFTSADHDFLLTAAGQGALALGRARLYGELEERVRERTEQLERSREQLQALSARLQVLQEEERTHMAREIHDQLGAALTGLKMDVAQLARAVDRAALGELPERTQALAAQLDALIGTVRRIATDLRPAVLDDFGLLAALEWQLQEFQARTGIQCVLTHKAAALHLDGAIATAVFRVFQEALTNIARHAQASLVEVALHMEAGRLLLQVRDNGQGISEQQLLGKGSLGLVGMRERVRQLRGELQIHGAPGQGTTLRVSVPMVPGTAG